MNPINQSMSTVKYFKVKLKMTTESLLYFLKNKNAFE